MRGSLSPGLEGFGALSTGVAEILGVSCWSPDEGEMQSMQLDRRLEASPEKARFAKHCKDIGEKVSLNINIKIPKVYAEESFPNY